MSSRLHGVHALAVRAGRAWRGAQVAHRLRRSDVHAPLQAGRPRGHALLLLQHPGLKRKHLQAAAGGTMRVTRAEWCCVALTVAHSQARSAAARHAVQLSAVGQRAGKRDVGASAAGPAGPSNQGSCDRCSLQFQPVTGRGRAASPTCSSFLMLAATCGGSSFTSRLTTASTSASSFSISLISASTCRGAFGIAPPGGLVWTRNNNRNTHRTQAKLRTGP